MPSHSLDAASAAPGRMDSSLRARLTRTRSLSDFLSWHSLFVGFEGVFLVTGNLFDLSYASERSVGMIMGCQQRSDEDRL